MKRILTHQTHTIITGMIKILFFKKKIETRMIKILIFPSNRNLF